MQKFVLANRSELREAVEVLNKLAQEGYVYVDNIPFPDTDNYYQASIIILDNTKKINNINEQY